MRQSWRWFGPDDPISLDDVRQAGATGVVTALYDLPPGAVWTRDRLADRRTVIEANALDWVAVESLNVSEAIKTQGPDMAEHLAAWKASLEAIAAEGPRVVCYNFMSAVDWTRTALAHPLDNGGNAMGFDLTAFAAFDIHILARPGAAEDYAPETVEAAARYFSGLTEGAASELQRTVLAGLPGAKAGWTLDQARDRLAPFDGIDADQLRRHLVDFLSEVVPVAERLGLRLCAHPDDPPFPILGLPRILSSEDDYAYLCDAVDSPANGITFCTGALGVRADFDPVRFLNRLGDRVHFAHLRNTERTSAMSNGRCSFYEAEHLSGDLDMVAAVQGLLAEEARRRALGREDNDIPFRPDHGHVLCTDLEATSHPGYPLVGRLRGLAELRGVIAGLQGPGMC
jgi:mannonate dehydratase